MMKIVKKYLRSSLVLMFMVGIPGPVLCYVRFLTGGYNITANIMCFLAGGVFWMLENKSKQT